MRLARQDMSPLADIPVPASSLSGAPVMGVVSILIKSRAGRDSVQATNRYLSSSNIVSPRREANVRLWSQFMILGLQRRAIHASIPLCLLLCLFAPARAQLGSGLSAATSAPGDKYSLSGTVV